MVTRFLTERQLLRATAVGLDTDSEGGLFPLEAGVSTKIFDRAQDQRRPVLVRIQNSAAAPLRWSEDKGLCNALQLNGVLLQDTVGGANPAGDGDIIEFRAHIPKNVYVHCDSAVNILVTLRYADEG